MGRQHDFSMDNLAFMGIVFLFLVVFGKEPLAALVGGGSNSGLAAAALDNPNIKVGAWFSWNGGSSFLPDSGHKKSREPVKDFLLGGAAGGRLVFSFERSGQGSPKICCLSEHYNR